MLTIGFDKIPDGIEHVTLTGGIELGMGGCIVFIEESLDFCWASAANFCCCPILSIFSNMVGFTAISFSKAGNETVVLGVVAGAGSFPLTTTLGVPLVIGLVAPLSNFLELDSAESTNRFLFII